MKIKIKLTLLASDIAGVDDDCTGCTLFTGINGEFTGSDTFVVSVVTAIAGIWTKRPSGKRSRSWSGSFVGGDCGRALVGRGMIFTPPLPSVLRFGWGAICFLSFTEIPLHPELRTAFLQDGDKVVEDSPLLDLGVIMQSSIVVKHNGSEGSVIVIDGVGRGVGEGILRHSEVESVGIR